MKKERMKGFVAGLLVAVLALGLIGTAAATIGKRTVEVDYTDIKIELNGEKVTPVDANGNAVEPFAINGTTYLPVRAVSNALGLDVGWDGATSTVKLENKALAAHSPADVLETMKLYKEIEDAAEYGELILDSIMTRMLGTVNQNGDEDDDLNALNDLNNDIAALEAWNDAFSETKDAMRGEAALSDELNYISDCLVDLTYGIEDARYANANAKSFIMFRDTESYSGFMTWYSTSYSLFRDAKNQASGQFDVMYQMLADAIS